jgi:uncharacterized tellurite resistance protein B-like protein
MSILDFLKLGVEKASRSTPSADTETVRKITAALDRIEPQRAKFIASFAYVLSRVARADLKISGDELQTMERIVATIGALPEEQAVLVVQMAKTQNILFGATENYLVTREFSEIATQEEKMALLECLFAVSAADTSISSVEDTEIRQIAGELKIEHKDFIAVRSRFREHLEVLKNSRDLGTPGPKA